MSISRIRCKHITTFFCEGDDFGYFIHADPFRNIHREVPLYGPSLISTTEMT